MEKQKSTPNKLVIGIFVANFILLCIYFIMAFYCRTHFYFGSAINSISVSAKTVDEAEKQIYIQPSYILELDGLEGRKEKISGTDIDLRYNVDITVKELKEGEDPFKWVYALFNVKDYEINERVSYNEELLRKVIDNLSFFDCSNVIEPQSAGLKYSDGTYVIANEVYGNKVNKDNLYEQVVNAITKGETAIDLKATGCYIKPKYTSGSQKIIDAKNILNKYISSKITYTFGDKKVILDGSTINKWIEIGSDFEIIFHEEKVKNYLDTLRSTYEKYDNGRYFITSSGGVKEVSGGSDWNINSPQEVEAVITSIKGGQTIAKNPIYTNNGAIYNGKYLGNTYLAINLTKQHLWFYRNGALIVEGDIVTGNVVKGYATPSGIYSISYKQRDTKLEGLDYSVPVSYWMPFNGGIGLHDAGWRSEFGNDIYWTNGSHGCVNTTYYVAKTVYYYINPGDLVICYY
ncbi:MAG: L,D-transpeptidase family protein [Clostridiaceae bacterium]